MVTTCNRKVSYFQLNIFNQYTSVRNFVFLYVRAVLLKRCSIVLVWISKYSCSLGEESAKNAVKETVVCITLLLSYS